MKKKSRQAGWRFSLLKIALAFFSVFLVLSAQALKDPRFSLEQFENKLFF